MSGRASHARVRTHRLQRRCERQCARVALGPPDDNEDGDTMTTQRTPDDSLGSHELLAMSAEELDDLFTRSAAGAMPDGEYDGTAIAAPGTEFAEVAAKLAHLLAWKGKVFDARRGVLENRVTPFDLHAVVATVYRGESWFDEKECIILDYSETSLIAHWIRDEIREVAAGLYLGLVFWDKTRILYFALHSHA